MHYKNGRAANNGDKIMLIGDSRNPQWQRPVAGVLYDATAGNNACNGMLAPFGGGNHICPNLAECLHLEDALALLNVEVKEPSLT